MISTRRATPGTYSLIARAVANEMGKATTRATSATVRVPRRSPRIPYWPGLPGLQTEVVKNCRPLVRSTGHALWARKSMIAAIRTTTKAAQQNSRPRKIVSGRDRGLWIARRHVLDDAHRRDIGGGHV